MKHLFALFFAFIMIFAFAACGSVEPSDITDVNTEPPISTDTNPDADSIISIVLLEQDGIKITLKGYDPGSDFSFGPELKLLVENNSTKNITVQVRDVSVNGFMTDPSCSIDVVNGKKANGSITWFASELEENEITKICDVEFTFHIFDSEDWETVLDSDVITVTLN